MKYLMLIYMDESLFEGFDTIEEGRVLRQCGGYHDSLVASGHSLGAARLRAAATATTLRKSNGALAVTDGPFAETKEVFAGFQLLECRDLDEAIAIASRFPGLNVGLSCELRPVDEDPPHPDPK